MYKVGYVRSSLPCINIGVRIELTKLKVNVNNLINTVFFLEGKIFIRTGPRIVYLEINASGSFVVLTHSSQKLWA